MVEQQYLAPGLPHSDGLSGAANLSDGARSSATAPPTSAYPDLTPYGAVSSFDLSTQCDSATLLTPISAAGSPPLHHHQKLVRQYPPPPSTPGSQIPTPPGSSKMYHNQWTQFDLNGQSSQTSSPMAPQPPLAPDYLDNSYVEEGRRTPGAPHQQYMGAFSVSNGPEPPHIAPPYYVPMEQHHNPMMIRDNHPMPIGMEHREIPSAPLLNQPHPSNFRQQRRSSAEEPSLHGLPDPQRSINGSPRRRNIQSTGRVKKRPSKSRGGQSRNPPLDNPLDEHKNCLGVEEPPVLKKSCPDEERCIFESRWQHRHQKGQDMWESIQNDFKSRFGNDKTPGKEMLQMKFKRGRSKYIQWLGRDEELLREAWTRVEKQRYQSILETFFELGGSRNMRLSATDIEVKVVNDLKLEEGLYMESYGDANVRRRRKVSGPKKRPGARAVEDTEMPLSDEIMSVSSHNTHEDEVINQAHGRSDIKWEEDSSGGNEVMDMPMWDPQPLKIESGVMQRQRNDRVARQAYEQTLRLSPGTQPMYGRRRGS
ncbi:Fc.00g020610.m01.CDS01 [Cosmosporella sp. VM-42]